MATKVGLTVIKRFPYRGDANEEWSNTYHLTGSVPADAAAWKTLFDALVLQEKTIYTSATSVIRGYGYDSDADDAVAVWSEDLTVSPLTPVPGTLASAGGAALPGDDAIWARWKTSRLNSLGKAIYLRKYFHDVQSAATGGSDVANAVQKATLAAFAAKMHDGTFAEGRTITARTHDDTILNHGVSAYITTRTLKRRGKRPGS